MSWESAAAAVAGVLAPVGAIGATVYYHRRSRGIDAISAQTGAATETRAGQAETRATQNDLNDHLQIELERQRKVIEELRAEVKELKARVDQLMAG